MEVLIECTNYDKTLKPGIYVNVHFLNAPKQAITVPTKAIYQMNNEQFVFVKIDKNRFIRRKVEAKDISKDKTGIKSGVKAGEKIVSEGGIYLLEVQ